VQCAPQSSLPSVRAGPQTVCGRMCALFAAHSLPARMNHATRCNNQTPAHFIHFLRAQANRRPNVPTDWGLEGRPVGATKLLASRLCAPLSSGARPSVWPGGSTNRPTNEQPPRAPSRTSSRARTSHPLGAAQVRPKCKSHARAKLAWPTRSSLLWGQSGANHRVADRLTPCRRLRASSRAESWPPLPQSSRRQSLARHEAAPLGPPLSNWGAAGAQAAPFSSDCGPKKLPARTGGSPRDARTN